MVHYSMQLTHAPSTTLLSSLMISALIKLIGKRMVPILFSYKIKLFCLECFINKNWMNLTNIFHLLTILYLNMHRGFDVPGKKVPYIQKNKKIPYKKNKNILNKKLKRRSQSSHTTKEFCSSRISSPLQNELIL